MKRSFRIVKIFKSFQEQEAWDIKYYAALSPEERQRIAGELRRKYYGQRPPRLRNARSPK
jgi:hypothetical protein